MSVIRARRPLFLAALVGVSLALAGCGGSSGGPSTGAVDAPSAQDAAQTQQPKVPAVVVHSNVPRGARGVPVDRRVHLSVSNAQLTSVELSSKSGTVRGSISPDKASWTAGALLEPGTSYTVRTSATSEQGAQVTRTSHFRTVPLTLDQQTYPSIFPLEGQTVGIGMPVIVRFDVPVTDHASIERHLHVTSVPAQRGSWHWISNNEVHWRPATYWKPGSTVTVSTDINSVPAGNGIFGQLDRTARFHVGASHIYRVNTKTDQLRVYDNGTFVRQIPVTTGQQPEFTTRSGIKVIVQKLRHTRMNSETIGINPNSPNGYNLGDVQFAMRLTYSGEFLHAAPWSVYAQGHENVSHGCTGMSTANAAWLYAHSSVGDVVVYTGTSKMMTLTNGFGDWNESFAQYKQGSALHP
jgi:lipoprotein-anchoring transpeptidase ErfK/SrfK